MTFTYDVREISGQEIDMVSGADGWGKATGVGMVLVGVVSIAGASASVPMTAGASSLPAYLAVTAGFLAVAAGMEKIREE